MCIALLIGWNGLLHSFTTDFERLGNHVLNDDCRKQDQCKYHGHRGKGNAVFDSFGRKGGGTDKHEHVRVFSYQQEKRCQTGNQIEGEDAQGEHRLIFSGKDGANQVHRKAEDVVYHVDNHAHPQRTGVKHEVTDDQSHQKGVWCLHQIAVEHRKQNCGQDERKAVTKAAHRLEDHAAEHKFFYQWSNQTELEAKQDPGTGFFRQIETGVRRKREQREKVSKQRGGNHTDHADSQRNKDAWNTQRGRKTAKRESNPQRNVREQHEQEEWQEQADHRREEVDQLNDAGGCQHLIAIDTDCRTEDGASPQNQEGDKRGQNEIQQDGKPKPVGIPLEKAAFGEDGRRRSKAVAIHIGVGVRIIRTIGGWVRRNFVITSHKQSSRGENKKEYRRNKTSLCCFSGFQYTTHF